VGDALFEFFEPRKNRTPEEIALDDELENDVPAWPTPEYIQERLEELNAMPPSPDVTAEKIWLTRPTEELAQFATSYRAVRDFTGPTLADRETETEKAKQVAETFRKAADELAAQKAAQRDSCDDLNAWKADAEATYAKEWQDAVLKCIQGKGRSPFRIDLTCTQTEAARAIRRNTQWPEGWSPAHKSKYRKWPSVRVIADAIHDLENTIKKPLYRHKPGSKHSRCQFCLPPRS